MQELKIVYTVHATLLISRGAIPYIFQNTSGELLRSELCETQHYLIKPDLKVEQFLQLYAKVIEAKANPIQQRIVYIKSTKYQYQ